MKAKVKDTGEIVDVKFSTHPNPAVDETYWWCSDNKKVIIRVNLISWNVILIGNNAATN